MRQADFVELECEDCHESLLDLGEKRRTRCKRCGWLVCRWCYHHVHLLPLICKVRTRAKKLAEFIQNSKPTMPKAPDFGELQIGVEAKLPTRWTK